MHKPSCGGSSACDTQTATTHGRHQLGRWRWRCFTSHYHETGTIPTYYPVQHPLDRHWGQSLMHSNFVHRSDHGSSGESDIGCLLQAWKENEHSATETGTKMMRGPGRAQEHCSRMKEVRAWMQWKENILEKMQEGGTVQMGGQEQDRAPDIHQRQQ